MRVLVEFNQQPLVFEDPVRVMVCQEPKKLGSAFEWVEKALSDGFYVAGFMAYEAGYAFEPALMPLWAAHGFPLMCLGAYRTPGQCRPRSVGRFAVDAWRSEISRTQYDADIHRIHEYIRTGDVYQITYCLKNKFSFSGNAYALYRALFHVQPVPYPAYIEWEDYRIVSLSPEMFVWKSGRKIMTRPMKGSWPREHWRDRWLGALQLHHDAKNRAENVMIADLLRNDLGRIGSHVHVPRLFEVNSYRTIHQMTSTVCAEIPDGILMGTVFRAIFPSGSVTGAPKMRAMQIIASLERSPRRIYTGAIGYITPERNFYFNVPIRTALIHHNQGELGIGGGIVWDSTPEGEWAEGQWKAKFLKDFAR